MKQMALMVGLAAMTAMGCTTMNSEPGQVPDFDETVNDEPAVTPADGDPADDPAGAPDAAPVSDPVDEVVALETPAPDAPTDDPLVDDPPEEDETPERPDEPVKDPADDPKDPTQPNDKGWVVQTTPELGDLNGVWVSAEGAVWVAGADGRLNVSTKGGVGWSTETEVDSPLYAVHGRGTVATAVGAGGVIIGDGQLEESTTKSDLHSVWFSAPKETYKGVAVGAAGTILYSGYEGDWFKMYAFTDNGDLAGDLNDVWGADGWNIWAVGDGGVIMKYNGKHWGQVKSPTGADLVGIAGDSADKWYVIGADGTIAMRAYDEWFTYEGALNGNANALAVSEWGTATVVSDGGAAWGLAGKAMSWYSIETGVTNDLLDIVDAPQGQWIVGSGGLILHKQ